MALHLGEIAQDDRSGKQRSGTMMALHSRSRAGPVRSSLGMRVPQTLMPKCSVNHVARAIEPKEPSKRCPYPRKDELASYQPITASGFAGVIDSCVLRGENRRRG